MEKVFETLWTELNYKSPPIANELDRLWKKLNEAVVEWDKWCPVRRSMHWIDVEVINMIEVKEGAATLCNKLEQIGSLVQESIVEKKAGKAKSQPEKLSAKAKAIAVWTEHPDWTDTKIAKEAGISRTTLYDYPEFKNLRAMQKQDKNKIRRGNKNKDGNVEAIDE
jgi:hypothetical protein